MSYAADRAVWVGLLLATITLAPCVSAQDSGSATDDNVFRSTVRPTDPLTPQQELEMLKVPAGFKVTLFASEPQLQKPLNMAFDANGRLWVTGSNEYPHPAKEGEGHDSVRVLEDTTGDGTADKVTVFADNLNIPIGLYPYKDGVVVFSIPNILFLRDTDGDGKADSQEVLYGPFDTTRDTHGMNNAFRRGFDGWLYCCHGFNNQSRVAGHDGHQVSMNSGNTYRIRLDGSRIEHFTHGQVNPFGMTIDANGDIFTSDCHTKPVTLLMRDGFYESFGKPDDGLGYVPDVMDHLHGSTAIDGICQYQGTAFPKEYHENLFVGNVMTCRVHRNSIVRTGASIRMQEEPDLLMSEDPWFRPTDIQVGPDGALFVADFYNRIIGHYEVPLDHPGRDRKRGRIFKVSYVGDENDSDARERTDAKLISADLPSLISALKNENNNVRQLAADQIVDRIGEPAAQIVLQSLLLELTSDSQISVPQLLWVLKRLNVLDHPTLAGAFENGTPRTRIHVMRIGSESSQSPELDTLVRLGLRDASPLVRRAAADCAAQHSSADVAKEVVNAIVVCPEDDVHLYHGLKIALRNQLSNDAVAQWFAASSPPDVASRVLADVVPAVKTSAAAELAIALIKTQSLSGEKLERIARYGAENITGSSTVELIEFAKSLASEQQPLKTLIWTALAEGYQRRKAQPPVEFTNWSEQLSEQVLQSFSIDDLSWGEYSLDGRPMVNWRGEQRFAGTEAAQKSPFLSSLPGSEKGVGVLRSRPFVLPFSLQVQICGHLGYPQDDPTPENRVVLRDFLSGEIIKSALAPRNDVAATYKWEFPGYVGRRAYLEVIDGLEIDSYAWIAVGSVSPRVVSVTEFDPDGVVAQLQSAVEIIVGQQAAGQSLSEVNLKRMMEFVAAQQLGGNLRSLAARSLLMHRGHPELLAVADLLRMGSLPRLADADITEFCVNWAKQSGTVPERSAEQQLLGNVFAMLDEALRRKLVKSLAESKDSAELLLSSIEFGTPSAQVLRDDRLSQQLSAYGKAFANRVASLKADLPPETDNTDALTASVVRRLRLGEGDSELGKSLFSKHCSACHRRAGTGGNAGPQLDGIGTRGTARLLEDILHPNRNVDVAFRTSILQLSDGRVLTGLVRESPDGLTLTLLNTEGKAQTVAVNDIEQQKQSTLSLMPANVSKLVSESELVDLVKWLMN